MNSLVIMENVNLKAMFVMGTMTVVITVMKKDVECDGKRSSAGFFFQYIRKLSVSPGYIAFFPELVELSILLDAYSTFWSPNIHFALQKLNRWQTTQSYMYTTLVHYPDLIVIMCGD